MKDILKKYAFVFIAGAFFLVVIIAYSVHLVSNQTPTKTVDGKQIVYSIAGIDKSADEVYDYYYDSIGENAVLNAFTNAVVDEYKDADSTMKEEAKAQANNVILYYQQNYGSNYESTIVDILRGMGYDDLDDLDDYFIRMEKYNDLMDDYLLANPTSEMSDYQSKQGRTVSHILVKMEDPDNPSEAEMQKVTDIENALNDGEDFAVVAATYSDDSSASNGGFLGAMNTDTEYVEAFKEAALALNSGEMTTDWVKTEYGWHLIKCESTDMVDILDGGLRDTILNNDVTIGYKALWAAAENEGVSFANDEIKELIENTFIIEESMDDTSENADDVTSDEVVETETPSETVESEETSDAE